MKKYAKITSVVLCFFFLATAIIGFCPVSWEAAIWGEDYVDIIYRENITQLASLYAENHPEYSKVSQLEGASYTTDFQGREVFLSTQLSVQDSAGNPSVIDADFIGKRTGIKTFSWEEG